MLEIHSMPKINAKPPSKGNQNKHLTARISYLHQAATFLSQNIPSSETKPVEVTKVSPQEKEILMHDLDLEQLDTALKSPTTSAKFVSGSSCHLLNQLRLTARKAQILVNQDVKRLVCKRCDNLLISGTTSAVRVENESRHGKKPWADVLVIDCLRCGAKKRYPVGANRQARKGKREAFEAVEWNDEANLIGKPRG